MKKTFYISMSTNVALFLLLCYTVYPKMEDLIQRVSQSAKHQKIVMVGDSHSALGKWNLLLGRFDVMTVARGGFTSEQVHKLLIDTPNVNGEIGFVLCGTNDLGTRHFSIAEYLQNIESIVTELRKKSIKPVVQTVFLRNDNPAFNDSIKVMNNKLRDFCHVQKLEVIDLERELLIDGKVEPNMYRDKVHLNTNGYRRWARIINNYLKQNHNL